MWLSSTTVARAAIDCKDLTVALRHEHADSLSLKEKTMWIVVWNRRCKSVKTIRPATMHTATQYRAKWKPKAKGTYRYYVCGKDFAGNAQHRVGSAKVVVRQAANGGQNCQNR